MSLEAENQKHLEAAQGFVELGMFMDANEELEEIDPEVRHLPEILAVRLEIYRALQKWELMQVVAKKLSQYDPDEVQWWISWADATRQAESIDAARHILALALNNHPRKAIVHYNLACYECQLGDITAAKKYLDKAFKLDPKYSIVARDDEDLMPMWMMLGD
jgi:tetratricopeptide (TPR) repeat protein